MPDEQQPDTTVPGADARDGCRLGVLAFGDSITNGGGELQWGVALQSWAMWTARGLGIPYSPYAVDGATVEDVVNRQIPLFERTASTTARYTLGCLYIGTNDLRLPGFDLTQLRAAPRPGAAASCATAATNCSALTIPLDMGRPRNRQLIELHQRRDRALGCEARRRRA